ncbi:lysoplasmalogenase [Undibacterium sp. KW1]|uniref:lysoplasmalogenase n=1 Tax=Undibacterium sp. KW1 TaxID=2058624 RepID=UPI001331D3A5|nr:lysoplasmalogenase [Undibacterium sp. KW1]BBB58768.1 lysoplasmalogenase [Undibacterium sp. KW1]
MPAMLRAAFIFIFAALAIAGAEWGKEISGAQYLHYVFKPLTTLAIFFFAWQNKRVISRIYQTAILIGIICSLIGDIFLMLPGTVFRHGFLCGLLSFLLAHVCFLRALISDSRFASKPLAFAGIAALGVINLWILWPGLPTALQIPVVVYVCLLLCMTAQAISRGLLLRSMSGRLAMIGGLCFMLSDTLLAYNRFYSPIAHSPLLILSCYYLALWLIAASVTSSPSE